MSIHQNWRKWKIWLFISLFENKKIVRHYFTISYVVLFDAVNSYFIYRYAWINTQLPKLFISLTNGNNNNNKKNTWHHFLCCQTMSKFEYPFKLIAFPVFSWVWNRGIPNSHSKAHSEHFLGGHGDCLRNYQSGLVTPLRKKRNPLY